MVSPDAGHIYLGSTWNGIGVTVLEANLLGTAYARVDTFGNVAGTVAASDGSDSSVTHHLWVETAAWNNGVYGQERPTQHGQVIHMQVDGLDYIPLLEKL